MKPSRVSLVLTALGVSEFIYHDRKQSPFDVTLAVTFSSSAAGGPVAAVQFIVDDLTVTRQVGGISQATTVITVQGDSGQNPGDGGTHGLSVGDVVQIVGSGGIDGVYPVASVTSATGYTLTSTVSKTFAAQVGTVGSARVFTHGSLTGLTARATGNYTNPVIASRLQVTSAGSAGVATLAVIQGISA